MPNVDEAVSAAEVEDAISGTLVVAPEHVEHGTVCVVVRSTVLVVWVGLDVIIFAGTDWVDDATDGLLIIEVTEVADIGVVEVAFELVAQGTVCIVVKYMVWVISIGVEDLVVSAPGGGKPVVKLAEVEGSWAGIVSVAQGVELAEEWWEWYLAEDFERDMVLTIVFVS